MRMISSLLLVLCTAFATSLATGQEYPTRPVRIVVPNAPVGTPRGIIAKINADTNRVLSKEAVGSTPEETEAKIRDESERYGKLIKALNIKRD